MMIDESQDKDSPVEAVPSVMVGEYLQRARQAMQMSVADVANALYITPTYVNLIEKNQFHKLPGTIFARGYIKSYARLVNLSVDAVMAQYFEQTGDSIPEYPLHPVVNEYGASMRRHAVKWAVAIILGVLLLPTLGWWYAHNNTKAEIMPIDKETTSTSTTAADSKTTHVVIPLNDVTPTVIAAPLFVLPSEDSMMGATASTETENKMVNIIASPIPENTADIKPSSDTIDMVFTEKCWIQVKNTDGVVLHDAGHEAGEHITIGGKSPFYVWAKNAKAVTISFNGELVKINNVDNKGIGRLVIGK